MIQTKESSKKELVRRYNEAVRLSSANITDMDGYLRYKNLVGYYAKLIQTNFYTKRELKRIAKDAVNRSPDLTKIEEDITNSIKSDLKRVIRLAKSKGISSFIITVSRSLSEEEYLGQRLSTVEAVLKSDKIEPRELKKVLGDIRQVLAYLELKGTNTLRKGGRDSKAYNTLLNQYSNAVNQQSIANEYTGKDALSVLEEVRRDVYTEDEEIENAEITYEADDTFMLSFLEDIPDQYRKTMDEYIRTMDNSLFRIHNYLVDKLERNTIITRMFNKSFDALVDHLVPTLVSVAILAAAQWLIQYASR